MKRMSAPPQHQSRRRMAQQVAGAGLGDAGGFDVGAHPLRQPDRPELQAVAAEKESLRIAAGDELGPHLIVVGAEPGLGPLAQRHDPILAALAQPHRHRGPRPVHVQTASRTSSVRRIAVA